MRSVLFYLLVSLLPLKSFSASSAAPGSTESGGDASFSILYHTPVSSVIPPTTHGLRLTIYGETTEGKKVKAQPSLPLSIALSHPILPLPEIFQTASYIGAIFVKKATPGNDEQEVGGVDFDDKHLLLTPFNTDSPILHGAHLIITTTPSTTPSGNIVITLAIAVCQIASVASNLTISPPEED